MSGDAHGQVVDVAKAAVEQGDVASGEERRTAEVEDASGEKQGDQERQVKAKAARVPPPKLPSPQVSPALSPSDAFPFLHTQPLSPGLHARNSMPDWQAAEQQQRQQQQEQEQGQQQSSSAQKQQGQQRGKGSKASRRSSQATPPKSQEQQRTRPHPPKRHSRSQLDPDLLFRDLSRERPPQLPALGARSGAGKRRSSSTSELDLGPLSPHRVLPHIAPHCASDADNNLSRPSNPSKQTSSSSLSAATTQRPQTADSTTTRRHNHDGDQDNTEEEQCDEFVCHDPRDMARYLEKEGVRTTIQRLVEGLVLEQPGDPIQFMIDRLERDIEEEQQQQPVASS